MQIQPDSDSFRFFPYPSDGKGNNGGFDLIKNPEKIDDITEFKRFPELRRFIAWLNFESERYLSFGCDGGPANSEFTGYIEFSFRNPDEAKRLDLYQKLFDDFEAWTIEKYQPEEAIAICSSLNPRMAEIFCDGSYFGIKISLYFLAQTQADAAQLLDIFFGFLKEREL
jgi:hypothetical protein